MIQISLTRLVDFAIKAGSPKVTSLRETKKQIADGYDPIVDYYKQIRNAIIDHHKLGKSFSVVESIANNVTNKSKQDNYPLIAAGYKKFRGTKSISWFKPPSRDWTHAGVSVSLNPELGLDVSGSRHVIKLYFKGDEPRKLEVKAILALMDDQLQDAKQSLRMGILDVRRSKLITDVPTDKSLVALMCGEAAAIATIWPTL